MVLEKDSSVLGYPGEISKPLDADHHGVCKYESPDDSRYITVRNVLKSLVGKAKPKGKELFLCYAQCRNGIDKTVRHRRTTSRRDPGFQIKFRRVPLSPRVA